jgi:hypothetical protein
MTGLLIHVFQEGRTGLQILGIAMKKHYKFTRALKKHSWYIPLNLYILTLIPPTPGNPLRSIPKLRPRFVGRPRRIDSRCIIASPFAAEGLLGLGVMVFGEDADGRDYPA